MKIFKAAILGALLFSGAGAVEIKPVVVTAPVSPLWVPGSITQQHKALILPEAYSVLQPPAPSLVPEVVHAVAAQSRLLTASPDLDDALEQTRRLAGFSHNRSQSVAQEARAAALVLGLATSPDLHGMALRSPAYRGLLHAMHPADVEALRQTGKILGARGAKEPALKDRLEKISRQLDKLSASGSLDEIAAQLSKVADNNLILSQPEISPNFARGDPAREARAAKLAPADALSEALRGVELPSVLAYKAASLALSADIKGVFSEIGAAQKISGDFYKIHGQKIIHASLSPYAREASDQRYSPPAPNAVSEDYTSLERVRQQLDVEYAQLTPAAGVRKFVLADTARTSWGNGHAWLGVRAQLAAGEKPVDVILHVRMLGERTRNQKDVLGAIGVSALFGAYHSLNDLNEFIKGLGDGISTKDFSIDFLSIRLPDGSERAGLAGNLELLKQGLARQILVAPGGVATALSAAGQAHKYLRWSVLRNGKPIGAVDPPMAGAAPPQGEPILVHSAGLNEFKAEPPAKSWTVVSADPDNAVPEFGRGLFPAARGKQTPVAVSLTAPDSQGVIDFKAKKLNREAWVKGVFADVGGYQSVATRFFEASNSHAIFDVFSFPGAAQAQSRYGSKDNLSDAEYLKKQLAFEFGRIGDHTRHSKFGVEAAHRRFALVTQAEEKAGVLVGMVGLRLEDEPGASVSETLVNFEFRGGSWQDRRNALAALGVNLLYASHYRVYPQSAFTKSLREGLPAVGAEIGLVEVSGTQAQGLAR